MGFLITYTGGGSLTYKDAVRVASTANFASLTGATPLVIDGVTLVDKDRVLLKNQTNATENGIYVATISGGTWTLTRALDANTSKELLTGMLVPVSEGTSFADKNYQLTTNAPIVLGITNLTFVDSLTVGLLTKADRNLGNLTAPTSITVPLLSSLGSVTAPSYSFIGDTNTGVWSSGADTLNLSTGGAERMRVDSNGNVGINTTTPNSRLQIVQSGSQIGFTVFSTGTNNTAELYNQGTTNYTLALNSAANSATTGASIGGYFARGTLGTRQQTLSGDTLLSVTASGYTGSGVGGISGAFVIAADQNTTGSAFGGQLVLATTPNSTVTTPVPRMVVKNDGKVGINTLLPSEQLDVSGTVKSTGLKVNGASSLGFGLGSTRIYHPSNASAYCETVTLAGDSRFALQSDGGISAIRFNTNVGVGFGPSSRFAAYGIGGGIGFRGSDGIPIITGAYFGSDSVAGNAKRFLIATEDATVGNYGSTNTVDLATYAIAGSIYTGTRAKIAYSAESHVFKADSATGQNNTAPTVAVINATGLELSAGLKIKARHGQTGIVTAAVSDIYIGCDSSGGVVTVNLPTAISAGSGKQLIIKDESGAATINNISIVGNGGDLIDGSGTQSLVVNYEAVTLICDGAGEWFII